MVVCYGGFFWLFFYFELRHNIHPLLAGALCLVAFYSPEMFAYTYLVQTDYSNAIFFVIAVAMFQRYFKEDNLHYLVLSSVFLGLACWTRRETIFFVPLAGVFLWHKHNFRKAILYTVPFSLLGVCAILLWNYVFIGGVVPRAIELGQFNFDFNAYFSRLLKTMGSMNSFIFNADYWGYSVTIPLALIAINLVIMRKRIEFVNLIWIVGLYLIFALIIQHVVGANVAYTFRRGFFKIILLLYIYLSVSGMFSWLSSVFDRIAKRPLSS